MIPKFANKTHGVAHKEVLDLLGKFFNLTQQ
jgi:hypothetical protein